MEVSSETIQLAPRTHFRILLGTEELIGHAVPETRDRDPKNRVWSFLNFSQSLLFISLTSFSLTWATKFSIALH